MNRCMLGIALLLPVLAGCESYTWSLGYANTALSDAKHGEDCEAVFGLGGTPDVTGVRAMHQGGITKLRNIEYRVNTFHGAGSECVIAHGE